MFTSRCTDTIGAIYIIIVYDSSHLITNIICLTEKKANINNVYNEIYI